MKRKSTPVIRVKTSGYSAQDRLVVDAGVCKCGAIQDGIAFCHDGRGGWVLAYTDLIQIATAAARARGYALTIAKNEVIR